MAADDVREGRLKPGGRTLAQLQAALRTLMGVATLGSAVGLLAYWADDSCSYGGGELRVLVSLPAGLGYGAMLLGLPVALALVIAGLRVDWRGSWWRTLGWLLVGAAITAPAIAIASLACFA